MWSTANLLSTLRLVAAPVLLALAWQGHATGFVVGLAMALCSDLLDGWIARRWQQTSELGAKLDSWGDLAMYTTLALGVWWLRPDVIRGEALFVVVALVSYVLPIIVGLLKFGRLTSYHTWGDKLSSVVMAGGILVLVVWQAPWLFRLGVVVLAVAETEEIAITVVLRHWRADVASIVHAWRLR